MDKISEANIEQVYAQRGECDETILHKSIEAKDMRYFAKIIAQASKAQLDELLCKKDFLGATPLHVAAFYGNEAAIITLICRGANPLALDNNGFTPVSYAVLAEVDSKIITLLHNYAKSNIDSYSDRKNLTSYCKNKQKILLDLQGCSSEYPLHIAALNGDLERVNELVKDAVETLFIVKDRLLPISYAVIGGNEEVVRVVGAATNTRVEELIKLNSLSLRCKRVFSQDIADNLDSYQATNHLLHMAIHNGSIGAFDAIIKKANKNDCLKEILNNRDSMGATPLHIACYKGEKLMVSKLLEFGASLAVKDNYDFNPQSYIYLGSKEAFKRVSSMLDFAMSKAFKSHYHTLSGEDIMR
jgi:ankyrin repeat protein